MGLISRVSSRTYRRNKIYIFTNMFGSAMRMGMRQCTRRSMAVCSRITPVSQYANVVPQYTQVPVNSTALSAIASSTKISTQLQQLVDAGLITLDGDSDDEPVCRISTKKYDDDS